MHACTCDECAPLLLPGCGLCLTCNLRHCLPVLCNIPVQCPGPITLLLPHSITAALGHTSVPCSAIDARQGFTCGELLHTIWSFYQQEVQLQSGVEAEAAAAGGAGSGCETAGGVVVQRLQLLGHRRLFEGLYRVTRDPHGCIYELCLA